MGLSNKSNGIKIASSSNNNTFQNGSYISISSSSYYLNASYFNTFSNTNFTSRKVQFTDNLSQFNYSNNNGVTWISTNVSIAKTISRNLINWTQTNLTWTDSVTFTWRDSVTSKTSTGYYNIAGLLPNTTYHIYINSASEITSSTDENGILPQFNVTLNTIPKTMSITPDFLIQIPIDNKSGKINIEKPFVSSEIIEITFFLLLMIFVIFLITSKDFK